MRRWIGQASATGGVVVRGYAQDVGLPTDPQALLQLMPPSVQATINQGMSTYGALTPAIDLAGTVSSGGTIDEAATAAAVSAAASFIGGPVAGAALAAASSVILGAESLMRAFFDLLGLYDHPKNVSMCGLIPTGSIPAGPNDPNWVHLDSPTAIHEYLFGPQKFRSGNVVLDWGTQVDSAKASLYTEWLTAALGILYPNDPYVEGPERTIGVAPDFERYFATLLRNDLERWANCNPYIPPRQLLFAAQAAWNQSHSAPTVSFQPHDWPPEPDTSLVSSLLGNMGDPTSNGQRALPLDINTMSQLAPTTSSSAGKAATIVVAAPITLAFGTLAYAWIMGRSVDSVMRALWSGTKRFVRRVTGEVEHLTPNPLGLFERQSTTVQSLLFPRPEFSPSSARSWARRHGYRAGKVHSTGDYVRLRQHPPGDFKRGSFRTISFGGSGIKAVIGRPR
jgi:hypothetical protein